MLRLPRALVGEDKVAASVVVHRDKVVSTAGGATTTYGGVVGVRRRRDGGLSLTCRDGAALVLFGAGVSADAVRAVLLAVASLGESK